MCGVVRCRKGDFIKVALFLWCLLQETSSRFILATTTLYNFQFLPLRDQAEIIIRQSAFLMSRTEKKDSIMLYKVDSFYVEVYYLWKFKR
jgi:hypothetical protein